MNVNKKHTSRWATIAVLTLCIITRIYWISEKESLYGDETTSVILSQNATGWGNNTYKENHIYDACELKNNFFVDDKKGLSGWSDDIAALWNDNRDPSHASLYYMLLRTSLTDQDQHSFKPIIWRGCILNLSLFIISFVCMAALLKKLLPGRHFLRTAILAMAYMNPMSISSCLLLREYQLAECAILAFSLFAIAIADKIKAGKQFLNAKNIIAGGAISAILLSSGYFNAIFALMAGIYLIWHAFRHKSQKEAITYFLLTVITTIVLCTAVYKGFFNFTTDVRTSEVLDKAKGNNFIANLYYSAGAGVKMLFFNILGPLLSLWFAACLITAMVKRHWCEQMPSLWIFAVSAIWFVFVLILSTWKMTRYVAPCIPMIAALAAYYSISLSRITAPKRIIKYVPLILLLGWTFSGKSIEYLEKDRYTNFPDTDRAILYTAVPADRDMLTLLTPCLTDSQQCVIVSDTSSIQKFASPSGKTVYVFADKNLDILQEIKGYDGHTEFNDWLWIYKIKRTEAIPTQLQ